MIRTVMENAGLAFWPSLSLIIFGFSCFGMVLWLFRSGSADFYRSLSTMALEESKDAILPASKIGKR